MFDFRKIEAFCKVCELRSFSKAGEALFLSQPTISAHVQSLERDFEVRLLDRMGRTVLPTPAGAVLYRYAKQAFSHLMTAKTEIDALAMEVTGELLIGSNSIPARYVLPKLLAGFTKTYPKVQPSLIVESSPAIVRQILDGNLMAGIVSTEAALDPQLLSMPVLQTEIIVIAPPDLAIPAARLKSPDAEGALPEISFETASSLYWILREETSATRKALEEAVRNSGHDPRLLQPRLVVDSSHASVQFVKAGLGVSAATRIAVNDDLLRGDIQAFALTGVTATRQFSSIMNSRRLPFPSAAVFMEYLHAFTSNM